MKNRPTIPVTGFWMRNDIKGHIEVLVQHEGKWIVVFGKDGPGPTARDTDQVIDHMIHAGGVQNLIDHGTLHPAIRGRRPRKPDRRAVERRATKRRTDDKRKARLKR